MTTRVLRRRAGWTCTCRQALNLGDETPGMEGNLLRMRLVTMEPGAVFGPRHDPVGRPGTVYVLAGIITDHRDGVDTEYGPRPGWPEDRHTRHWLENKGCPGRPGRTRGQLVSRHAAATARVVAFRCDACPTLISAPSRLGRSSRRSSTGWGPSSTGRRRSRSSRTCSRPCSSAGRWAGRDTGRHPQTCR